ncbi:hypothetical protein C8J56DRAFT_1068157 [Mycena floridula]|nr:hypothetical protein C8J56DRAFT_1068157 [Mycena floridula]
MALDVAALHKRYIYTDQYIASKRFPLQFRWVRRGTADVLVAKAQDNPLEEPPEGTFVVFGVCTDENFNMGTTGNVRTDRARDRLKTAKYGFTVEAPRDKWLGPDFGKGLGHIAAYQQSISLSKDSKDRRNLITSNLKGLRFSHPVFRPNPDPHGTLDDLTESWTTSPEMTAAFDVIKGTHLVNQLAVYDGVSEELVPAMQVPDKMRHALVEVHFSMSHWYLSINPSSSDSAGTVDRFDSFSGKIKQIVIHRHGMPIAKDPYAIRSGIFRPKVNWTDETVNTVLGRSRQAGALENRSDKSRHDLNDPRTVGAISDIGDRTQFADPSVLHDTSRPRSRTRFHNSLESGNTPVAGGFGQMSMDAQGVGATTALRRQSPLLDEFELRKGSDALRYVSFVTPSSLVQDRVQDERFLSRRGTPFRPSENTQVVGQQFREDVRAEFDLIAASPSNIQSGSKLTAALSNRTTPVLRPSSASQVIRNAITGSPSSVPRVSERYVPSPLSLVPIANDESEDGGGDRDSLHSANSLRAYGSYVDVEKAVRTSDLFDDGALTAPSDDEVERDTGGAEIQLPSKRSKGKGKVATSTSKKRRFY